MKILSIKADRENICLHTDAESAVTVHEYAATVGPNPSREISRMETSAIEGIITLPRKENANDRIYSRFIVTQNGEEIPGVRYVTDFSEDLPENTAPYPQPSIIKTLSTPTLELGQKLGIPQGLLNISLLGMMTTVPGDHTISYEYNGKTYYFLKEAVERTDAQMQRAPIMTMILLNAPRTFNATGEQALVDKAIHPSFDWDFPGQHIISAFNMETEEGVDYYGAFVEFLVERYTRPDKKYGCAVGAIISNEVTSQYIWCNAGEKTVEDFTYQYTQCMRLAWICGRKHCSHFRVYISMDHFWSGLNFSASEPLRYYSGRSMIELLNKYSVEEGNFDWCVAYHPYPENLAFPDFWNDRVPTFAFDTPKITFKNVEVLEAFLSQEPYLYNGQCRRVIFSEQGFNSQNGPMQAITEKQAAAAYVLAYIKCRNMKNVDMMTHHSCVDNPGEFGLNLGIFRYDPDAPGHVGEPKPIFESFQAMDTPDEAAVIEKARAFIGEELFDLIANPPIFHGDLRKVDVLGNA